MGNIVEKHKKAKQKYLGKVFVNNQGCKYKVIDYINNANVIIEFCDEYKYKVKTKTCHIVDGGIRNVYYKSICNRGYIGEIDSKKYRKEYEVWIGIIKRCYDKKRLERNKTYQGCVVCEKWLCFKNFVNWLIKQENYKKWLQGGFDIDKDILAKGNKIYSPETCCLVPHYINIVMAYKRLDKKTGVRYDKKYKKYYICIKKKNKGRSGYGWYNTEQEAIQRYIAEKEQEIKNIAQQEYNKGNITKRCYQAMIKYKIKGE